MTATATLSDLCDGLDTCPDPENCASCHDCIEHVVSNGLGTLICDKCGEPVDIADATCTWCGRYPCACDDAYERYRDERMGL